MGIFTEITVFVFVVYLYLCIYLYYTSTLLYLHLSLNLYLYCKFICPWLLSLLTLPPYIHIVVFVVYLYRICIYLHYICICICIVFILYLYLSLTPLSLLRFLTSTILPPPVTPLCRQAKRERVTWSLRSTKIINIIIHSHHQHCHRHFQVNQFLFRISLLFHIWRSILSWRGADWRRRFSLFLTFWDKIKI